MKTIPILFSTDMVNAIRAGRKTQTRRVVKKKYSNTDLVLKEDKYGKRLIERQNDVASPQKYVGEDGKTYTRMHMVSISEVKCPYGRPGDILWVRETFTEDWHEAVGDFYYYRADFARGFDVWEGKWKPSIFMPKAACRIFLKITNVAVQRLNNISEEDAIAEGVYSFTKDGSLFKYWYNSTGEGVTWSDMPRTAVEAYKRLWQKINGPESWEENPWVWVIEFEPTDKPEGF